MVYTQLIGAGLSLYGGYLGSKAKKEAAAKERARIEAENARRRKEILEASEQAARSIGATAQPLLSQAAGMERASRFRDPMVEQGLVAGLRQQAGAQAAQDRQTGGGDRRGAVVGQLLRGQGLLAAESQRIQRFTQMSQMAAGLRTQSAEVMGRASQARMQGALAAANITYNGPAYSADSPWAVGLGALGGAIGGMSDSDFGWGGDGTEDLSGFAPGGTPTVDITGPTLDEVPLPQAATSDVRDFMAPDVTSADFEPLAPMGMGSRMDNYYAPPGVGKPPPGLRNIRFDESRAPMGGQGITARPQEGQYITPVPRAWGSGLEGDIELEQLEPMGMGGPQSGTMDAYQSDQRMKNIFKTGLPRGYSNQSWYKQWYGGGRWWR